jgi:hypothetical protein
LGIKLEETTVRFIGNVFPEMGGSMNTTLDACFEATTELISTTGSSCKVSCEVHNNFCHETAPNLANANWSNTRILVQSDESVAHESSSGSPGSNAI